MCYCPIQRENKMMKPTIYMRLSPSRWLDNSGHIPQEMVARALNEAKTLHSNAKFSPIVFVSKKLNKIRRIK
jgi:hypothetical protein